MRRTGFIAALLLAMAPVLAAAAGGNARLAGEFRRADADGSGMLSRAEAERAAPAIARNFDAIDADRDGQISAEEMRALRRTGRRERGAGGDSGKGGSGSKFEQHFARADTDADGALSRAETARGLPRVARKFSRIDRNGDGLLTREEMHAWLAARRAARTSKVDPG